MSEKTTCALCKQNEDLRAGLCYQCAFPTKEEALGLLGCIIECFNEDEIEWKQAQIIRNFINNATERKN